MSEAASSESAAASDVNGVAAENTPAVEEKSFADQVLEAQGLKETEDSEGNQVNQEPEQNLDPFTKPKETPGDDDPELDPEKDSGTDEGLDVDGDKTPKGFVRHEALHAARGEISFLKTEGQKSADTIAELQERIATLKAQPQDLIVDKDLEDFTPLSDEELQDLSLDDPGEFAVYLRKERRYEAAREEQVRVTAQNNRSVEDYNRDSDQGYTAIEAAFPGIYDDGSDISEKLGKVAVEVGFDESDFFLTDPQTQVIIPGANQPVALGARAAKVMALIGKFGQSGGSSEAELRARITKEVQTELLKKMQTSPGGSSLSLADIPTAKGDETHGAQREPTDAEILSMTPSQKKNWHLGKDWRV